MGPKMVEYFEKCVDICWKAVVQDPPVVLSLCKEGSRFKKGEYRDFTARGPFVEYVVGDGVTSVRMRNAKLFYARWLIKRVIVAVTLVTVFCQAHNKTEILCTVGIKRSLIFRFGHVYNCTKTDLFYAKA